MKRFIFLSFIIPLITILTFFAAAAQEIPLSEQQRAYLIGPGDEIAVKVLGEPQFDFNATIDDEGMVQVPFFENRLNAKCLSEKDLRVDVAKMMSKYLRNPMVSLRVTERKSRPPASVMGEVKTAQQVVMMRQVRLLELLSFTGGLTEDAGGMVQVFHGTTPICSAPGEIAAAKDEGSMPYRFYSISAVKMGKEEANPVIYPGDIVVVQKALPVYVTGEVRAPQGIRLTENGISLTQAIAMVSGITREAKSKDVKIYRLRTDKTDRDILTANLDLIKAGKQKDIMLEAYDIIEVDKAKKSIAQTILEIAIGAGKGGITSMTNGLGYRVMY